VHVFSPFKYRFIKKSDWNRSSQLYISWADMMLLLGSGQTFVIRRCRIVFFSTYIIQISELKVQISVGTLTFLVLLHCFTPFPSLYLLSTVLPPRRFSFPSCSTYGIPNTKLTSHHVSSKSNYFPY